MKGISTYDFRKAQHGWKHNGVQGKTSSQKQQKEAQGHDPPW
jgi:hypothetical protein